MTAPPDDFTVRSADWISGYAEGWKAALAEREPPRTCASPGCTRHALTHPTLCAAHRHQEPQP